MKSRRWRAILAALSSMAGRLRTHSAELAGLLFLLVLLADTAVLLQDVERERTLRMEADTKVQLSHSSQMAAEKESSEQHKLARDRWTELQGKTLEAEELTEERESARAEAAVMRQDARSGELAAIGEAVFRHRPESMDEGVLIGLESVWRMDASPATEYLHDALDSMPRVHAILEHKMPVESLRFSPDGRFLATVELSGRVRAWSVEDVRELWAADRQDSRSCLAFASDSSIVATAGRSGQILAWSLPGGNLVADIAPSDGSAASYSCSASTSGTIVVLSEGGSATVFDTSTGKVTSSFAVAPGTTQLRLCQDGKLALTGDSYSSLAIWDVEAGEKIREIKADFGVRASAFSPDCRSLALYVDGAVRVQPVREGSDTAVFDPDTFVETVEFSPDGTRLAAAGLHGMAGIWRVSDKTRLLGLVRLDNVQAQEFSSDGRLLAAGLRDGHAVVVDVQSGRLAAQLLDEGRISALAFQPGGRLIAAASGRRRAVVWDLAGGPRVATGEPVGEVQEVRVSPDFRHLAIGTAEGAALLSLEQRVGDVELPGLEPFEAYGFAQDGRLFVGGCRVTCPWWEEYGTVVWDLPSRSQLARLSSMTRSPAGIDTSASGPWIASRYYQGTTRFHDGRTGNRMPVVTLANPVEKVVFCSGGPLAAILEKGGYIELTDVEAGIRLSGLEMEERVDELAFSPDCRRVAVQTKKWQASLWDSRTGLHLGDLGDGAVYSLPSFSPDGSLVLSISASQAWLQSAADASLRLRLDVEGQLHLGKFSPDGRHLALATEESVLVGLPDAMDKAVRLPQQNVQDLSYSPSGNELAAAGEDGEFVVWQLSGPAPKAKLRVRLGNGLKVLGFTPDGRRVLTVDGTNDVRLWLWEPRELVFEMCSRLTHNLEEKQWERLGGKRFVRRGCPNLPGLWSKHDGGRKHGH